MRLIQIALGNVDSTVGAVRSNTDRLIAVAREMDKAGATVGAFPEQAFGGYPPEDLIQWRAFVAAQRSELDRFAKETAGHKTVFVLGAAVSVGGQIFNVAAVVHGGKILGFVPKEKLPTYNVFYEARVFSRGVPGLALDAGGIPLGDRIFDFDFGRLAVEVCEDAWSPDGPMRRRCFAGAEVVVNVSASPYRIGVQATRAEMLATRSSDNQATLAYVNLVGAQDGLVFDGGGLVFQNGRQILDAPRFREGFTSCVVDLDRTTRMRQENTTWRADLEAQQRGDGSVPATKSAVATHDRSRLAYPPPPGGSFFLPPAGSSMRAPRDEVLDELFEALAMGVEGYFAKSAAFKTVGVALSGGRDSLLSLLVAWRATQRLAERKTGPWKGKPVSELLSAFYMPTRFSTEEVRAAAVAISRDIRIELRTVSIDDAFEREIASARAMLGGTKEPTPLTKQNIQARLRSLRMWSWSNSESGLFLQTGDMSEKAAGYTTVGGDLEGCLSVIANVPKTVVVALLERLHVRFKLDGIALCLKTAPSPELEAKQSAESELMPFPVLDACLYLYAGEKLAPDEVAAALPSIFPEVDPKLLREHAHKFATLFTRSIYKWVQAPISLHVGSLDLERERALQLPVVQQNEWRGLTP